MLLKTLIRKINKIITQSCHYYEAKTQHQKHTHTQTKWRYEVAENYTNKQKKHKNKKFTEFNSKPYYGF